MKDKRHLIGLRLDPDYEKRFRAICTKNHRKLVDQVKVWIDAEEEAGTRPMAVPHQKKRGAA